MHYPIVGLWGGPIGAVVELGMAFIGYKMGSLFSQPQESVQIKK